MDFYKIVIVVGMIGILVIILIAIKLFQGKSIITLNSGRLKLTSSLPLSKETSAHIVSYGNSEFLISASKNGSSSILPLHEASSKNPNNYISEI